MLTRISPILAWLPLCLALSSPPCCADLPPLVSEAIVDATPDQVWDVWTTKQGIQSWMVPQADIDLRVGGKMRTHYDPKGTLGDAQGIEHTILAFDPKRMFAFKTVKCPETFPFKKAMEPVWNVVYMEAVDAQHTRVTVRCLGYGDDEESRKMRAFFAKGNAYTLELLKKLFAKRAGL